MPDATAPPILLCVAPNPSIDRSAEIDRLQPGSIHRPRAVVAVPGGKGLNVARAARTLGAPVKAIALLAGHAGRWIDAQLARLDIPHEAVWADGETRTCISVLDRSAGQLTEFYEAGDRVGTSSWRSFEQLIRTEVRGAPPQSLMILSGSLPVGVDAAAVARIVIAAKRAHRRVLVDTSGPWLAAAIGAQPDLVKVNAEESGAFLGREIAAEADGLAAATALVEAGAGAAIVTLGRRGAVAWDGSRGWVVDPPPVDGVQAVGAGDAFLAGLAVAMVRRDAFELNLRWAAAAAAASTLVAGPGNLDPRAAHRLLRSTVVRRLG